MQRARRIFGRERGAALVETAVVLPLLVMCLFGIIDFGGAFNDWIANRQGAREGARQAVTGRVGSDTSCGTTTAGSLSPAAPNANVHALVCLAKDRVDLPADRVRVKLQIEGSYADKKSLQVCTMVKLHSLSGVYDGLLDNRVLRTSVQMKIEQTTDEVAAPLDVADLASYEETPFSGQSWSSCVLESTT